MSPCHQGILCHPINLFIFSPSHIFIMSSCSQVPRPSCELGNLTTSQWLVILSYVSRVACKFVSVLNLVACELLTSQLVSLRASFYQGDFCSLKRYFHIYISIYRSKVCMKFHAFARLFSILKKERRKTKMTTKYQLIYRWLLTISSKCYACQHLRIRVQPQL